LQVTEPLAGAWQTVQLLPQELTLVLPFATQVLPQRWYPASHLIPQTRGAPLQVDAPLLAGLGQALHELPQLVGLVSAAQAGPQTCYPGLQAILQTPPVQTAFPLPLVGAGQDEAEVQGEFGGRSTGVSKPASGTVLPPTGVEPPLLLPPTGVEPPELPATGVEPPVLPATGVEPPLPPSLLLEVPPDPPGLTGTSTPASVPDDVPDWPPTCAPPAPPFAPADELLDLPPLPPLLLLPASLRFEPPSLPGLPSRPPSLAPASVLPL
jgi:hypothetical protein